MNPYSPRKKFFPIEGKRLVFFGHLIEAKGIGLVIRAFPDILREVPDCRLIVIGTGDLEEEMKKLVHELNVDKKVDFLGFVPEYKDALDIVSECTVGLAPYKPLANTITEFAEPFKIKEYLSCGLPVIMTGVPEISKEVKENGAGIVIDYDQKELVNAAVLLLKNKETYLNYKKNVYNFIYKYDWNVIFEGALIKTIGR